MPAGYVSGFHPYQINEYSFTSNFVYRSANLTLKSFLYKAKFQSTAQVAMKETKLNSLGPQLQAFIKEKRELCQPESVHICDGSEEENDHIVNKLIESQMMKKLPLYENW